MLKLKRALYSPSMSRSYWHNLYNLTWGVWALSSERLTSLRESRRECPADVARTPSTPSRRGRRRPLPADREPCWAATPDGVRCQRRPIRRRARAAWRCSRVVSRWCREDGARSVPLCWLCSSSRVASRDLCRFSLWWRDREDARDRADSRSAVELGSTCRPESYPSLVTLTLASATRHRWILVQNPWFHWLNKSWVPSHNGGTIYRVAI